MKKLLSFILLCIPLYAWGDNLIFNPSFDMTPWDTGWTIDTSSSSTEGAGASVDASSDTLCNSSPRSCKLFACAGVGYHLDYPRSASARACIYQEITPVTNCECRVYFKNGSDYGGISGNTAICYARIFVKVNNRWVEETSTFYPSTPIWTKWKKIYGTSETVSGIKFCVLTQASSDGIRDESAYVWFWVDDVYIGEQQAIEEENSKSKNQKLKLETEISPNPFIQSTTIKYHLPTKSKVSLEIYDITGRTVKTLVNEEKEAGSYNISFSAKELSAGIYFAKLVVDDVKKTKKLTILR